MTSTLALRACSAVLDDLCEHPLPADDGRWRTILDRLQRKRVVATEAAAFNADAAGTVKRWVVLHAERAPTVHSP